MRYVCWAAVAALSILPCSNLFGQTGVAVTMYQYQNQVQITRTLWSVSYTATLSNSGPAQGAITAIVSSAVPSVQTT